MAAFRELPRHLGRERPDLVRILDRMRRDLGDGEALCHCEAAYCGPIRGTPSWSQIARAVPIGIARWRGDSRPPARRRDPHFVIAALAEETLAPVALEVSDEICVAFPCPVRGMDSFVRP